MSTLGVPLVSVIVPNYNHAEFLRQRLDSILAQTVSDFELILLDDASTDGSSDILRAYASHERVSHLVVNEQNSGSSFVQWRKGCALARGTWIWIAESDDHCAPDLLERLLELNEREKETLGFVFAGSEVIDGTGQRLGSMHSHTACFEPDPFLNDMVIDGRLFLAHYLKVKNVVPNASAVVFRRSLITDSSVWDGTADMKLCGDWLLWVRLIARTRLGYVHDELNAFRDHAATTRKHATTERKQRRLKEERIVRSALSGVPGVDQSAEERSLYEAWFQYFPYRAMFSQELSAIRLSGRSYAAFIFRFLAFKWRSLRQRGRRHGVR